MFFLRVNVTKVNEIHLFSTAKIDAQINCTKQLKDVNDAIEFIQEKFEDFEAGKRERER